jgi:hypothetical protein
MRRMTCKGSPVSLPARNRTGLAYSDSQPNALKERGWVAWSTTIPSMKRSLFEILMGFL